MYNCLIIIVSNTVFFSFFLSYLMAAPKVKPTVVADYNEHMNGVAILFSRRVSSGGGKSSSGQ